MKVDTRQRGECDGGVLIARKSGRSDDYRIDGHQH